MLFCLIFPSTSIWWYLIIGSYKLNPEVVCLVSLDSLEFLIWKPNGSFGFSHLGGRLCFSWSSVKRLPHFFIVSGFNWFPLCSIVSLCLPYFFILSRFNSFPLCWIGNEGPWIDLTSTDFFYFITSMKYQRRVKKPTKIQLNFKQ